MASSSTAPARPVTCDYPQPHPIVLPRGSRLALLLLKLWGWRIDFAGLPTKQGVFAVYPHTSNWDFPLGVLVKWALRLPAKYWGKDSLFQVPLLGRFARAVGGIPIDRSSPHGMVGSTVQRMQQARADDEFFWLVVAPEGTRSHTPGWKSGFYQVALQAGVPLGLIAFDWQHHVVRMRDFISLTGQLQDDYARMAAVFAGVQGYAPHQQSPITPLPTKPRA